jgi:broad specificity phosphatase PhoE
MSVLRFYFVRHGESENNIIHMKCKEAGESHLFTIRRHVDPKLTARGEAQVGLVARRLAAEVASYSPRLCEIWSSYLHRALSTARAIHISIPSSTVHALQGIYEVGGMYEHASETSVMRGFPGRTNAQLKEEFPFVDVADESCDDGWYPWTERETLLQAKTRAADLVSVMELKARAHLLQHRSASHPGPASANMIIVITHGDFFQLLLSEVAERYGVSPPPTPLSPEVRSVPDPEHVAVQNTSVTLFEYFSSPKDELPEDDGHSERADVSSVLKFRICYLGDVSHLEGKCEALVGS